MNKLEIQLFNSPVRADTGFFGLSKPIAAIYLSELVEQKSQLVVCKNIEEMNNLVIELEALNVNVVSYPIDSYISSHAVAISLEFLALRQYALTKINENKNLVVVTTLHGAIRKISDVNTYKSCSYELKKGMEINLADLIVKIDELGYQRTSVVSASDEYAVRGHVLDIFVMGEDNPTRIEFWGDEIDSIRKFDLETQRTIHQIESCFITPLNESIGRELTTIKSYADFNTIAYDYNFLINEYEKIKEFQSNQEEFIDDVIDLDKSYFDTFIFDTLTHSDVVENKINLLSSDISLFKNDFKLLKQLIEYKLKEKYSVYIYVKDMEMMQRIEEQLNIKCSLEYNPKCVNVVNVGPYTSFELEDKKILYLSYHSIFTDISKKKQTNRYKFSKRLTSSKQLEVGDYVVHDKHGIGQYLGITSFEVNNFLQDFFEVAYLGTDKLYVPITQINALSKYSASSEFKPKLNRLGSVEWEKTKRRVRGKMDEMSQQLIALYAQRENSKGFIYHEDSVEAHIFESEFEYELTVDQARSIEEIKSDMHSTKIMDRLLCGDVGFGKTEIAFRAAFKAIDNNKQVVYLCPTTILSNQHYQNALKRFANHPVEIALLNRYTSASKRKEIIQKLAEGKIDFLIGTHALFSKELIYKDLGLLIIDEEQRFGVGHKESIKEIKTGVDVLTLTATPIPRTLQMSLLGIRDLSLIDTPPKNRVPVQTYVIEENDIVIKEAIETELQRNGQIFILRNRISDINRIATKLQKLVPNLRLRIAHGRMQKEEIEEVMYQFDNHEFDCLISTTIIETGIDIPNANTLIIYDADTLGLAQLYQIRGRVGRSDHVAYAYMMFKPNKNLNEQAIKRLNVIKSFTNLGSGFKIASRDLSIRGAGDILGPEQAGYIDTIGVEMYMKMLKDALNPSEEVSYEKISLPKTSHVSTTYVNDDDIRLQIHQLINSIDSQKRYNEVYEIITDKYGKIDLELENYMSDVLFEARLNYYQIEDLEITKNFVKATLNSNNINGIKLLSAANKVGKHIRLMNQKDEVKIVIDIVKIKDWKHEILLFMKYYNEV